MYIDTHAHYDDSRYDGDLPELLRDMNKNGIDKIINAGSDMKASRRGVELAKEYDFLYACVGVHPHEAKNMQEEDLEELKALSVADKVVAIGEIGLDYYYDNSPRETQRFWFIKQLELALNVKMPVVIHSRDAAQECFDILKEYDGGANGGVIHCYSGSVEMALDYIDLGFHIGIGGVVTFKNAKKLREVVEKIPLSRILLETDSPYLSPEPNRGMRNDSNNLRYIAARVAEIRQMATQELLEVTNCNSMTLFNM